MKICRAGLLIVPTDPPCLYNLQVALRMLGHIQKAIDFTSIALSRYNMIRSWPSLSSLTRARVRKEANINAPIIYVCVKWGSKYNAAYVNALYGSLLRHNTKTDSVPRLLCLTEDPEGIERGVECVRFPPCCEAWESWWLKGALFDPHLILRAETQYTRNNHNRDLSLLSHARELGQEGVWMIYLDLDSVICGAITPPLLFNGCTSRKSCNNSGTEDGRAKQTPYSHTLYTLSAAIFDNEQRDQGINSSIMMWHVTPDYEPKKNDFDNLSFSCLFQYLQKHYTVLRKVIYKFDHYIEMCVRWIKQSDMTENSNCWKTPV